MINKRIFAKDLSNKLDLPHSTCKVILDGVIEVIQDCILNGKDISLLGLGKFSLVERSTKKGINPRTLESIQVPGYTTMKFKVGKTLSDKIKSKYPITK